MKRKTKDMSNGKHKWWFVLHDDEAILCDLDAKWSLLEVQTSWKLDPVSSLLSHCNKLKT